MPERQFLHRHQVLIGVVLVESIIVLVLATLLGYGWEHGVMECLVPLGFAITASWDWPDRWQRVGLGTAGLLSAQMITTHLLGGMALAHAIFFVSAFLVSLYRTRLTTLLLLGHLVVLHGVIALIDPHSVYPHDWGWVEKVFAVAVKLAWIASLDFAIRRTARPAA